MARGVAVLEVFAALAELAELAELAKGGLTPSQEALSDCGRAPYTPVMPPIEPSRTRDQAAGRDWYHQAFDALYLRLYARRDGREAEGLAAALAGASIRGPALEVACGAGRFLRALAARVEQVFGLDLSADLLREARLRFPGTAPPLVRGDMRRLPFRSGSLPLVLSLFTSFGYFADPEEDRRAVAEASRVLRPGGAYLLDFLNGPVAVAKLVPESRREVAGRQVREVRWVDPAGPFLRKVVEVAPGPGEAPCTREERVRLYTPADLEAICRSAGLLPELRWGGYRGEAFRPEASERFLLLARKAQA